METIHAIHQNDAEHRPQPNDDRPQDITELQGQFGTPDQRFIPLGNVRSSDN